MFKDLLALALLHKKFYAEMRKNGKKIRCVQWDFDWTDISSPFEQRYYQGQWNGWNKQRIRNTMRGFK